MRVGAAALAGAVFGCLGTLCFLQAFGTDYWLVATDDCEPHAWHFQRTLEEGGANATQVPVGPTAPTSVTVHHEGFFWRCVFQETLPFHTVLATLFTNQPESKTCMPGYLFPLPVAIGNVPHPIYDATAVYRGFWTLLMVLALALALTGGLLLLCGVPFFSHRLCRVGGAFLIAAACLFLGLVLLYVLWAELVDMKSYVLQEKGDTCLDAHVSVHYGWSFMAAAAGVPLELLSGMLYMLIGAALRK